MKRFIMTLAAVLCCAMTMTVLTACDKLEEAGMNDGSAYYNYRAQGLGFNYQEAAGPFDVAIRLAGGYDPAVLGGVDDKVIEACDECYENLKQRLKGKSGKVIIFKIRHPDGKQKVLKEYDF